MNLEFSDGMRKSVELPDFPGVTFVIQAISVRQYGESLNDWIAKIRFGVVSVSGITSKGQPVVNGDELANAIENAPARTEIVKLCTQLMQAINEHTAGGADEKNSESSPQ